MASSADSEKLDAILNAVKGLEKKVEQLASTAAGSFSASVIEISDDDDEPSASGAKRGFSTAAGAGSGGAPAAKRPSHAVASSHGAGGSSGASAADADGNFTVVVFGKTDGVDFTVSVKPSDTVASLMATIGSASSTAAHMMGLQYYMVRGDSEPAALVEMFLHEPEHGSKTLESLHMRVGSSIKMSRPFRGGKVSIQMLTGKIVELDAQPTDAVEVIKAKIQEKEGIPPGQQRLFHKRKELVDGRLLGNYCKVHEPTLHLILNLRGD